MDPDDSDTTRDEFDDMYDGWHDRRNHNRQLKYICTRDCVCKINPCSEYVMREALDAMTDRIKRCCIMEHRYATRYFIIEPERHQNGDEGYASLDYWATHRFESISYYENRISNDVLKVVGIYSLPTGDLGPHYFTS